MSDEQPPRDDRETRPAEGQDAATTSMEKSTNEDVPTDEPMDELAHPATPSESVLDILYGVLFQPSSLFTSLARPGTEPPLGVAVGVVLVVTLIAAWVSLHSAAPLVATRYVGVLRGLPTLIFILAVAIGGLVWFVWSAILQLTTQFFGGRGSGVVLFTFVGLSLLPRVLSAPVALVNNVAQVNLSGPFELVVATWTLYLNYLAVRATHGLNRWRGVAAVALPLIVVLCLAVFLAVVVITAILPFMGHFRDLPI